jgi:uncharacterized protein YaiI (UPF0178 family)
MRVWLDADAAPAEVKDVVFRASKRLALEVVVVANRRVEIPAAYPNVRTLAVPTRADEADRAIVERAVAGDLVITADVPLASQVVKKGVAAIDLRGGEYSDDNVGERLAARDLLEQLRGAGVRTSGPKPYSDADKRAFAQTFDRVVTRLLRSAARRPADDRGC